MFTPTDVNGSIKSFVDGLTMLIDQNLRINKGKLRAGRNSSGPDANRNACLMRTVTATPHERTNHDRMGNGMATC